MDIASMALINKNKYTSYLYNNTQAEKQIFEPPKFVKYPGNPVLRGRNIPWIISQNAKIYFPSVINAKEIFGDAALDVLYLYYSTDHATGNGGIGLSTASRPEGPWTDRGMIYQDAEEGGYQSETPFAVWNPETNLLHLYYHDSFFNETYRSQATCLATSPDGINFTRHPSSPIITVPEYEFPGDGHTGYAHVYRFGRKWVAFHLMGGTDNAHFGISYSDDGINWQTDPRPIAGHNDFSEDGVNRRLEYSATFPFIYRGELWGAFVTSPYISGPANSAKQIYVGPMKDFRQPVELYPAVKTGSVGEWDNQMVQWPYLLEFDSKLYMFYESEDIDRKGAFGIAIAEVN
ncbi:hypothetical protein EWH99_10765 [Sporolactobacillus sp. THM7-7]|nr:hypothetical protein EWH99_10765 [Sporolactobacillus sp. THM7-7]